MIKTWGGLLAMVWSGTRCAESEACRDVRAAGYELKRASGSLRQARPWQARLLTACRGQGAPPLPSAEDRRVPEIDVSSFAPVSDILQCSDGGRCFCHDLHEPAED